MKSLALVTGGAGFIVAESLSVGVPVLISRSVNIWADIVADGAGFAEEDTVEGCVAIFKRWLGLEQAQRERMRCKTRECFASRYTSKRAAVSLLSSIFQTMYIEITYMKNRGIL